MVEEDHGDGDGVARNGQDLWGAKGENLKTIKNHKWNANNFSLTGPGPVARHEILQNNLMRKAKEVKDAAAHIPSQSIIVVSYFVKSSSVVTKSFQ